MEKKIKDLLVGLGQVEIKGNVERVVKGITQDSRKVEDGFLFIAVRGSKFDGHQYIDQAIRNGAVAVICEDLPEAQDDQLTWIKSWNVRKDLSMVAANFHDRPSEKLHVIGVTGTNGKTTIATLLYDLFKELGWKVGLISTIEMRIGERVIDASLTTPDPVSLHRTLDEMWQHGCEYVFMEVSSHAVEQERVSSILFKAGVFTNLTHDHLDYHGSFANYLKAKKKFFDGLQKGSFALINADDKNGRVMVQNTKAKVLEYGLRRLVDYKGRVLSSDKTGLYIEMNGIKLLSRLVGDFNAYNLLAVYGVTDALEVADRDVVVEKLSALGPVKGRLEMIANHPKVVLDYAHTPDALENVLKAVKPIAGTGKITTVVGCGGDRDRAKRPMMARIAFDMSDQLILTSDNPRNEKPGDIILGMKEGLTGEELKEVIEIEDRAMAIKTAIVMSDQNDLVLIAGKGHEDYQEIGGKRLFFSDRLIVKEILSKDI